MATCGYACCFGDAYITLKSATLDESSLGRYVLIGACISLMRVFFHEALLECRIESPGLQAELYIYD